MMSSEDYEKEFLRAQEKFGSELFNTFVKNDDNILYSPLAIHAVLSLVSQGVSADSDSTNVFKKVLDTQKVNAAVDLYESIINQIDDLSHIELSNNTTIYMSNDYKIDPLFVEGVVKKFNFKIEPIDFKNEEAIQAINAPLSSCNEGILSSDTKLERTDSLVIINTVHLKGRWACSFGEFGRAELEEFSVTKNKTVRVEMMSRAHNYKIKTDEVLGATIVDIPFINKELSMVIILPDDEFGIRALEEKLSTADLNDIVQGCEKQFSSISIPKFKIEQTINLNEKLSMLGLGDIFEEKCSLSRLVQGSEKPVINKIIHRVSFEINEEGNPPPSPPRSPGGHCYCRVLRGHLRADHPFIVYVKSINQPPHVILQGRVMNPTS